MSEVIADFRRYVTDNPGAWMLHCHLQWHIVVSVTHHCRLEIGYVCLQFTIQTGMALVFVEGEVGQDAVPRDSIGEEFDEAHFASF